MELIRHKPRPITRDSGGHRDDRLFIVACDDSYAPKQYFDFFEIPRVRVLVVPTPPGEGSSSNLVLNRLLEYGEYEENDERWMLLDTDHNLSGAHQTTFHQTLTIARQNGINIAISRPCFDLWLLLHHVEEAAIRDLRNAREVELRIRGVMGEFNKTNLKKIHYPIESVTAAYRRAVSLDSGTEDNDIPPATSTRVYRLLRSILTKSLSSQLPSSFAELHSEINI